MGTDEAIGPREAPIPQGGQSAGGALPHASHRQTPDSQTPDSGNPEAAPGLLAEAEDLLESVEEEVVTTADLLRGLLTRLRLPFLLRHHQRRVVLAVFSVLMGVVSLSIIAVIAVLTGTPFVFPSLGPTAFLFFYRPAAPSASPRNTLVGCAIGICSGYLSLVVTGLAGAPAATFAGVTWPRVFAVALSFGLTTALLVLLGVEHPPALATTLIVSLGVFAHPLSLVALYGGVVMLTVQAFLINRAAGVAYPLWAPRTGRTRQVATGELPGNQPGGPEVDRRLRDEV